MRNRHLDILTGEMDRLIKWSLGHVFVQQIEQSIFRRIVLPVELDRQPQIEVSIVLDQVFDILKVVIVFAEYRFIHNKLDQRSITLIYILFPKIILLNTCGKTNRMRLSIADTTSGKAA